MKRRRGTDSCGDRAGTEPELPTAKAFVVQLSRETGATLQPFAGRVEHLATGRRLRFQTFEDFQAAVTRLLAEAPPR
jgi:hypothetical protein